MYEDLVVKYYTQYFDDFSSSYSTLCNRAETFGKSKRYEEALNDLNYAIAVKPHKLTAWCLRGIINGLNKFYMEALEDLNNTLYRDINNFLALKWRALCYYEIRLYNPSLWDLNLIINSGCADALTYLNRADVFWFKNGNKAFAYGICGEFQDTINDLNKNDSLKNFNLAIKTLLDNVATISNRAKLYCKLCQYNLALKDTQ
ncbi:hypothetical protein Glove_232g113 [Diversispora epigaea]|uniref:Uncharacterized protein n=1 Tax=Diversispora epigaea TaxID=1348612 RepID=A0A397IEH5_9GLOM|nr:hypothetical protein Glove_232g113 [Diversispora epigaea]